MKREEIELHSQNINFYLVLLFFFVYFLANLKLSKASHGYFPTLPHRWLLLA